MFVYNLQRAGKKISSHLSQSVCIEIDRMSKNVHRAVCEARSRCGSTCALCQTFENGKTPVRFRTSVGESAVRGSMQTKEGK
jgi:hypothetical protein